jgi:RNA polymerase sigma factor (sigma-70 family)
MNLDESVSAAAAGDRHAAQDVLNAVSDDVYGLALRMLGHPADAEDAAQEILIIVLTHLGTFRGESAFRTWVFRVAANHLSRTRRGRRETLSFELLDERLKSGLGDEPDNPEAQAWAREVRMRCTEAMLLSLDRDLRMAYILGEIWELPGEDAAAVLEVDPATYRKRLSRARTRLYDFMRNWCGVFSTDNPCRCGKQAACAVQRGIIDPAALDWSGQRTAKVKRAAEQVGELFQVAEALRGPVRFLAPERLSQTLRELLESPRFGLINQ